MLTTNTPILEKAKALYPHFFNEKGFIRPKKILNLDQNVKTVKGQKLGYYTGIIYLAPSNQSKLMNVCPAASAGCRAACLFTAGMGKFKNVKMGRLHKTVFFIIDRESFMLQLMKEIEVFSREILKNGGTPLIRLNGTSDIMWEHILIGGKTIFEHFPHVQFYDYTKIAARMYANSKVGQIKNYHLTFSRSECNEPIAMSVLAANGNVAMVFAKELPETYNGYKVIDGDKNDLRFLDGEGVIVGLKAKGKAIKDDSGFVIR